MNADLPPVAVPSTRHIVITIERSTPHPFDVTVDVDVGDLDYVCARAYLQVALMQFEVVDIDDDDGTDR